MLETISDSQRLTAGPLIPGFAVSRGFDEVRRPSLRAASQLRYNTERDQCALRPAMPP